MLVGRRQLGGGIPSHTPNTHTYAHMSTHAHTYLLQHSVRREDLEGGGLELELVAPRVVHAARARGAPEDEHLPAEEAGAMELPVLWVCEGWGWRW